MTAVPDAAVVELICERFEAGGTLLPKDIRINGTSVLAPPDPVIVHEISSAPDELVQVTLTLYAKRVLIGTAEDAEALA